MNALITVLFFICSSASANLLSYQDWKDRRVKEATNVLSSLKREAVRDASKAERAARAEINLQAQEELTPNDYFHLYLIKQAKNLRDLETVVPKLSKTEIAEILMGYKDQSHQMSEGLKPQSGLEFLRVGSN